MYHAFWAIFTLLLPQITPCHRSQFFLMWCHIISGSTIKILINQHNFSHYIHNSCTLCYYFVVKFPMDCCNCDNAFFTKSNFYLSLGISWKIPALVNNKIQCLFLIYISLHFFDLTKCWNFPGNDPPTQSIRLYQYIVTAYKGNSSLKSFVESGNTTLCVPRPTPAI